MQDRVAQTVERYIGRALSGHVRIEKEHGEFRTNCTIHLWQGMSSRRMVSPRMRIRVRIRLASGWTSGCAATSVG